MGFAFQPSFGTRVATNQGVFTCFHFQSSLCSKHATLGLSTGRCSTLKGRHFGVTVRPCLSMKVSGDVTKLLVLSGNNIDLTEALHNYVEEKVGKIVAKYVRFLIKVEVHLSVAHNPSVKNAHTAEVTAFARKHVLRASVSTESMYASIDLVSDKLERKLQKFKGRFSEPVHGFKAGEIPFLESESGNSTATSSGTSQEDISLKEVIDKYSVDDLEGTLRSLDQQVVKRKSFPVPRQSVEEAVLCLDYIDHDFYVFRNSQTGEINIVYKRNHGGIGLIVPEKES